MGPGEEAHPPPGTAAGVVFFLQHVGTGDVGGEQIRGELHAPEGQAERVRQGRNEQRLGEAGHADQQGVPAGEQRDQHQIDHLLLPDDPRRQRLVQVLAGVMGPLEELAVADLCLLRQPRVRPARLCRCHLFAHRSQPSRQEAAVARMCR